MAAYFEMIPSAAPAGQGNRRHCFATKRAAIAFTQRIGLSFTLEDRGEADYGLTYYPSVRILRSHVYTTGDRPARVVAGHPGPADPAHPDLWTRARPRRRPRHPTDVRPGAPGRTRSALSRAPTARGARLDCREMGRLDQQPQGSFLHLDAGRAPTTGQGND